MKRFLTMCAGILLICQFTPPLTLAQNAGYEVKGVVVDKSGMPILGATVVEKGTTNGVSTGIDGDYAIRAAGPESVIEVSYVGYKTVSLVASSSLLAHLTLEEDAMGIDDVVVIGYGSVKKNDMTGSVVAIKAEEFNRGAVVSTQDMLKGKVPGVHIIPGDGGPGSSATIRVRGAASLNASNDPLIVIDGVPIAVDGGKGMANPLETINPNDIESFTVLKDASAAAIYGSRASNGVILVTTKKGRGNTPRVSYSGSVSVQTNSDELPVMSPGEFRTYIDQVYPAGTTTGDKVQSMLGDKNTNWQDLVFRTAISHDHNVSLIGNINDRMPYRASVGYTNQQGTLETSKYERGTLDLSLSPNFFDKHLTVNLNAKGVVTSQRYASGGVVGSAAFFNPTIDPYFRNDDGSIDYTTTNGYWNYGSGRGEDFTPNTLLGAGPLSQLYDRDNTARAKRFIGNAQIDYKVHGFEALRFNLNLGLDVSSAKTYDGVNPGSFQAYTDTEARGWGQYSWTTNFRRNQLLEFYANFNKEWGIHHLDVMAGYSWQHFYSSDHSVSYFNETHEQKGEDSRYPVQPPGELPALVLRTPELFDRLEIPLHLHAARRRLFAFLEGYPLGPLPFGRLCVEHRRGEFPEGFACRLGPQAARRRRTDRPAGDRFQLPLPGALLHVDRRLQDLLHGQRRPHVLPHAGRLRPQHQMGDHDDLQRRTRLRVPRRPHQR